jgi:acylphosphatase
MTLHCYVSGKVQGVWFRANTKQEADLLGLTGFAKNLADGRVEVMLSGDRVKVEKMYQWLHQGPKLARVTAVSREELPAQEFEGFVTL